ncbi:hypothetical protein R1T16_05320, partial [Flavobacterium sp. DG1-102-2]|uniref:beta strand repeat-containing protein n=1 Tax=Flavobacterium sp. DG1-102-2 TaxID=3081663 RepID=UPI002949716B
KDGAVTTDKIGPDAVTNAKLADNAVQTENIAAGAVETSDIKDHAVTAIKLDATGATPGNVATVGTGGVVTYEPLNADNLANGKALLSDDLSVSAPEGATALLKEVTVNIKPEAVTDAKLAPNAVITSKIADDAVTAAKINADVAGAGLSQAASGALEIATDGVTAAMINPNVAGTGLTQDASGALQVDTAAIATGDITGGTEITVGNGVDSVFKNVTLGIEDNAITNAKMADNAIGSAEIINESITSADVKDGEIKTADIADKNVTADKLTGGTAPANSVATTDGNGVVTFQPVSTANLADKKDLTAYTNTTTDVVPSIEVPTGGANSVLVATSLKVAEGGITTGKLANGAVTTAKLADDAVTNAKLADNAVQTENIAAGAVETSDIKDGAVTTDKIGSDAVTNAKLADNAVQTENIANGTIIAEDLATGSVPATKLTADATDVGKVATVTSTGTVTYQTPSASAANVTNGQPLTSTDLSISPNGATALLKNVIIDINAGAVTNTKLGANAVDSSKIANESILSEDIKDGEVKTADLADKNVTAVKLDAGTGAADRIAVADINGNVTYSNAIPSGSIAGANMSAGDTSVTIGGATNGVGTVLKPVSVAVAADGITSDKIKNGEVKLADLDTNSVDSSKIVNESILSEDIKDGEVKTADIADKNVTAIKLNSTGATNGKVATADGNGNVTYENVSTANLADKKDLTAYTNTTTDAVPSIEVTSGGTNSVLVATSLKVADGGITTGKLANGAVTTAKLADDAVTNAKLADNAVQTENIVNGTIIAEDLAAGSVTAIKLAANGTTDANKVATAHANGTVTYETVKASDVSYVNTTSGLTATTVQGAIDQIVNFGNTQLNNITLIDEADGKVTLVRPNGVKVKVNKSDITYNSTTGVYTFTNGDTTDVNFGGGDVTGGTEITVSGGTDAAFKDVTLGIANNAVTTAKIANGTIIAEDLATGSVPATKLTADATDVGKVATVTSTGTVTYQSVSTANLADKGTLSSPTGETPISILVASGDSALLKNAQISVADNGITSVKIANESILSEDIKNGEVKLADLDANSVNSSKIVNESILSEDIKDGEVKTADLADKNVTATKLDAGTGAADRIAVADINGNVTYSNAIPSGSIVGATMSAGDTSVTIGGATNGVGTVLKPVSVAVAADGITSDKIKNGEVKLADLDANSVNSSKIVNESILSEDIKDGEVKTVDIADKNVTAAKLDASGFAVGFVATVNSLTGGVTYAAPTATAANVTNGQPLTSTDLSISGNGATALLKDVVVDIKAGAVTNSKINSNVAGVGLIKNTSTGALDVNVDGITSGKTLSAGDTSIAIGGTGAGALLKDANVSVATGGITATKINADVAGVGLVKNTSTGKLDIADGGVTTVKLADNSVNSSKIVNESILSEDIKDGTIAAIDMATPGNDKVLTSGSTGTVTWADKSTLAIEPWQVQGGTTQANANTQNIYQAGNVGIGLVAGDVPNTTDKLDVKGGNVRVRSLPTTAGAAKDKVVVADSQGVLKTVNASMSKVFYMPSVVFDTSVNGTFTKNLYQEYVNQFTGAGNPTLVSSPGAAAIPYYQNANELEYHILYYDTTVFSGVSLSASGVLTYTIIGPGTEASFMNILFVVK